MPNDNLMELPPTLRAMETKSLVTVLPQSATDAVDVFSAVMRMSPLAMVLTDAKAVDNPVVFCNQAFVRLTGFTEEEIIGRNCRFLQGPETSPAAIRALADAVLNRRELQVDLWNYRKDGSRFWNSMFVGPVYDNKGDLVFHFGSQIDASLRRDAEEAADRGLRMDTLGSMAAGLAHEINNLMTVVLGNVEGLWKTIVTGKPTERLGRIEWAARATEKLTRQMLSFASRQATQAEVVDLNQVLGELDQILGQLATAKSPLTLQCCSSRLPSLVNVGQFELALINLVKNAADASSQGGSILIQSAACEDGGVLFAEIMVTDQGTGMSPEVSKMALDPFFTTKERGKGTGLGLSMVLGFCQDAGGRMSIQSEAGLGTTIRMLLPISVT